MFTLTRRTMSTTSRILTLPLLLTSVLLGVFHLQDARAAAVTVPANLDAWTCVGVCGASGADGDITASPLGNAQYGYVSTAGSLATGVSPLDIVESGGGGAKFSQTNGSSYLSPVFSAQAGDTVSARFNYVSTDGKGFDDYAYARLVDANTGGLVAWMFTARSTNSNKQSVVPGDLRVDFDPDAVIVDYQDFSFNTRNLKTPAPVNWRLLGDSNGTCWRDTAEGCGFTGWLESRVALAGGGSFRLEVGVVNFGDQLYDSGLAFDLPQLTAPAASVPEPGTLGMLAIALLVMGLVKRRRDGKA